MYYKQPIDTLTRPVAHVIIQTLLSSEVTAMYSIPPKKMLIVNMKGAE